MRESQGQPLLLVCEELHWIDSETQAVLDLLVESLPTARVLLLVNYRLEYQHGWGSKTSYTPLRLDPRPEASADVLLQAHCHRGLGTLYDRAGQQQQERAALATAIALYRDMAMTFWLPQTEAAMAHAEEL